MISSLPYPHVSYTPMTPSISPMKFITAAAFCMAASPLLHGAVGIPYFQDFSSFTPVNSDNASVTTNTGFTESNDAAFSVYTGTASNAATNFLRGNIQTAANASAVVESSVSGGNNFTVSTIARASALTVGTSAPTETSMLFSLVAASGLSGSNLSGYYRLNIDYLTGTLGMQKVVGATITDIGTASGASAASWFTTSTTYLTFTLTGTYTSATSVDLVGTISDGTNTYTISGTDGSNALTGSYFGYRMSKVTGTSPQFTMRLDDFSLDVVPEPSSALLALTGVGMFISRRRR